jgi:hypothetical protein
VPDIVAAAVTIRCTHQDRERAAAGEIWQQTNDMPSAVYLLRGRIPGDRRLACVADQVKKISGTGMRQAELRTHS